MPERPAVIPSPGIPLEGAAAANPFGEQSASTNPYATPANPFVPDTFDRMSPAELEQRAKSKLIVPAIALIVFALAGLAFMALVGMGFALDPDLPFRDVGNDPAQRAGAMGFFAVYFCLGFLTRALQVLGAIAMFRVRSYGMAMTGAICALLPCDVYCCIPTVPFAIWALAVLNSADVKAAFGRSQ